MICFEHCTPPATAYGILLKNQKELILRIKTLEDLVALLGNDANVAVEPLREFGTNILLGNLLQGSGS